MLMEKCNKYETIIHLDEGNTDAWNRWGNTQIHLAILEENPGKKQLLLQEACDKLNESIDCDGTDPVAWFNWGWALSKLADMEQDIDKRRTLLLDSCDKYEQVTNWDDEDGNAWFNWGYLLVELVYIEGERKEKVSLLEEAKEKYLKAEGLKPGSTCYNLACVTALLGDIGACREWLEKGKHYGVLPDVDKILKDKDLESVQELSWFQDFIAHWEIKEQGNREEEAGVENRGIGS